MGKLSATKKRVLEYTRYEMLNKALEVFGDLGDDEELGPVDWPTVKRYIKTLNSLEGESVHPHEPSETNTGLDPTNLKDLRIRLLNGVQAAYWVMLEEGRITRGTANILMQSIDEAMDSAAHEPLSDWKGLKANVNFPSHYKFLTSYCPPKLVTYFTVERLESACYICAAFLRGHRIARQQLHEFIGDSDIASTVICESEAEGEDARKFLEDVRVTFPQVLRVVKTRQVTYSVLNHLIEYVQDLEKTGLLEQKEMLHLHDAVQTDLKRLLRNPPLVKMPKINDLINVHPLLGALPPGIREPLAGSSKEIMKLRGVPIYREGSNPTGVWFISNGVVKWTSKSMRSKYSLHPTFAHGSTLGLYEVLVRKPYICSMVTDSVVLGFFVESEKILSALRSDPAVEAFFWQESAIVLAKLLLPQVFEKMSMHDLRALIVEKSVMTTYIRGETIEIPTHSVGFLLEGFIKSHGFQEELITSPAALFPQHGNQSSQSVHGSHGHQSFQRSSLLGSKTSSFSHQGMWYQVETRARVIIFNTAALEADHALKRMSSSLLSVDNHMHRPPSREHGGLMSWPESFYKQQKEKDNHQTKEGPPANSLSAKAMQLSIFGSMVDVRGGTAHSSSSSDGKGTRNMGKAASFHGYPSGEGPSSSARGKKVDGVEAIAAAESGGIGTVQNLEERSESEEDDDDEDVIIRIDSPSGLSFRQTSGV
ncbi:Sodium/hydrogen exchanger 7 [Linum grandiflorum]